MKVKDLIEELQKLPEDYVVEVTDKGCCGCSSCEADEIDIDEVEQKIFIL